MWASRMRKKYIDYISRDHNKITNEYDEFSIVGFSIIFSIFPLRFTFTLTSEVAIEEIARVWIKYNLGTWPLKSLTKTLHLMNIRLFYYRQMLVFVQVVNTRTKKRCHKLWSTAKLNFAFSTKEIFLSFLKQSSPHNRKIALKKKSAVFRCVDIKYGIMLP